MAKRGIKTLREKEKNGEEARRTGIYVRTTQNSRHEAKEGFLWAVGGGRGMKTHEKGGFWEGGGAISQLCGGKLCSTRKKNNLRRKKEKLSKRQTNRPGLEKR